MLKAIAISIFLILQQNHVTMTGIDYIQGTSSLKVACRMHFDDFLKDLQTIDDDRNLRIIFSKQPFPADLINHYFNAKVLIYVNDKLLIGKLLTADVKDGEISLNLIYKATGKPRSITVRNMILTGWYSDQTNLTLVKVNDFEKGVTLTPEHVEETFVIK